ncbi:hypothetical protein FQ707_01510 [Bacteroidaceae bacterium HV4-6-C5C]|nr:hypothetical protein FQ707_01510 [Bacteroidaceae bacterium HV4-6-C5C]
MQKIPKIIHQVWSGIYDPLPKHFKILGETWKEHHPDWDYVFWDNEKMDNFIYEYYPQYWDVYQSFQYDVQRWDAIRYLILDKIGGMYADFDTECLKPHDTLFIDKTCCFSAEPENHRMRFKKRAYFNNALMASIPEHPFMKRIIDRIFSYEPPTPDQNHTKRFMEIMTTTGPLALTDIYEKYSLKEQVFLIPAEYVSPYDVVESERIRQGYESEEFDSRLKDVYSVHYFFGGWC